MHKSIKDYLGLNAHFERKDGTKMSHDEMYTKIVNDIGLEECIRLIPATIEEVQKALKTDKGLNHIPLRKWDDAAPYIAPYIRHLGITHITLSECVCTLKCAAKMWAKSEQYD